MKEELTTKMHAEFQISEEEDIQHRVWSLLSSCKSQNVSIEEMIEEYDLTMEQVEKYKQSYFDLFK